MSRFSLNGGLKPVPVPFMSDNTGRGITRGLQHPHHHQLNGVLLNPGSNPALTGGVHSGSRPNSRNGVIRQHRSRSRSKSRQRSRSNRASAVAGSAGQTSSNPSGSNGSGSGQSDTNPYSSNNGSTSRLVGTKF